MEEVSSLEMFLPTRLSYYMML